MNFKDKKVIAFDLGYTLVYNQREKRYMEFLKDKGIRCSHDQVVEAYHLADKYFMREFPGVLGKNLKTFFPWYLGVVNYFLGYDLDLNEQSEFMRKNKIEQYNFWVLYPWVKKVLDKLKLKGYQLALISNWDPSARALLKELGIYEKFDFIYISSEVKISKPDAGIFQLLLDDALCASSDVLYVGDNYYDDVLGSKKVGIDCLLINRYGTKGISEIKGAYIIETIEALLDLLIFNKTKDELNHA